MKLHILSDLHLGFEAMAHPRTGADVVILAGDIARPREAIAWASGFDRPVVYVPGNHEYYGGSLDGTLAELRALAAGSGVQVLADDALEIGGVRFLGTTLWTDFELFGRGAARAAAAAEASRLLRDFSRIRRSACAAALFTPDDSAALFARHAAWLRARLDEPHAGPTVVVTHHAPSPRSIHPRFEGSLINACFVSRAEHLLGAPAVDLWIHGHTHDSFDYAVAGTRVVCNPRGYVRDGVRENARFDAELVLELAPARPG